MEGSIEQQFSNPCEKYQWVGDNVCKPAGEFVDWLGRNDSNPCNNAAINARVCKPVAKWYQGVKEIVYNPCGNELLDARVCEPLREVKKVWDETTCADVAYGVGTSVTFLQDKVAGYVSSFATGVCDGVKETRDLVDEVLVGDQSEVDPKQRFSVTATFAMGSFGLYSGSKAFEYATMAYREMPLPWRADTHYVVTTIRGDDVTQRELKQEPRSVSKALEHLFLATLWGLGAVFSATAVYKQVTVARDTATDALDAATVARDNHKGVVKT